MQTARRANGASANFGVRGEPLVVAVGEAGLEFRVVLELLAAPEHGEGGAEEREDEGRDRHGQNLMEFDALSGHDAHHGGHGGGHGRGHHGDAGADHGCRNGALGAHASRGRHFGDHGIDREGHVGRAHDHHEEGAHERPHDGNHLRPAAKELLGPTDHQVKTARTLKDGRTGDDRRDDEQDGNRRRTRGNAKNEDEKAHAETAGRTEADAAQTAADGYADHNDGELEPEVEIHFHGCKAFFLVVGGRRQYFSQGPPRGILQFVALTHIMVFTGCLALVVFEGSACTSAAGFRYYWRDPWAVMDCPDD